MFHMKKKIAVLALMIGMSMSQDVWAAPAAPTGLTAPMQAVSEMSLSLIWDRPVKGDDAVSYNIYMDGKLVGKTAQDVSSTAKQEIRPYNINKDYLQSTWQLGAVSRKDEHTWQKIAMR